MPSRYEDNVFYLAEFDDQMEQEIVLPLTQEIQKQSRYRDGQIDLHITSPGGYASLCDHLIELVEWAKSKGVVVRTLVPSMAFSAGSMVAVAGTPGHRYMGPHAEHLIHYGILGSMESTPKQIERWAEYKHRQFKISLEHYEKHCQVDNLDMEMLDDGFFVPAKKAIKWKMADKLLDKTPYLIPPES